MTDQLISFETAKLAKDVGFDISSRWRYLRGELVPHDIENKTFMEPLDDIHEAPTQSLLQKFLREEHNMIVWLKPTNKEWNEWSIYVDDGYGRHLVTDYIYIKGYEEALEKGLIEALKLITK